MLITMGFSGTKTFAKNSIYSILLIVNKLVKI